MARFINDDVIPEQMLTAVKCRCYELEEKIIEFATNGCAWFGVDQEDYEEDDRCGEESELFRDCVAATMSCYDEQTEVEFSCENLYIDDRHENVYDMFDLNADTQEFLGINIIGDLVFCGAIACGDWESGLFAIIYWDGEKLCRYVPKRGNAVYRECGQWMAFGNGTDEKEVEYAARYGCHPYKIPFNWDAIREDIVKTIKVI